MAVTETFGIATVRSEFGANTFTLGDQLAPDALGLSGGGFVVAYNNVSLTSGLILLDFYDADRQSVGEASIPFDDSATTDAAGEPSVTELANGTVLVVWDEQNDTGSEAGIKGALFEQDGTPIDIDINLESGGTAFKDVDVTALSNGNFAVSFAFGSFEMFQLYTAAGAKIGGGHIMNTVTTGTQRDAQLTALAGGGFAAVWTDANTGLIKARVFEDDGAARTAEFALSSDLSGESQASIQALANGNFAVVYRDTSWNEGGTLGAGISLQVFDSNGGSQFSPPIQVNAPTNVDESDPDITLLSNGFFLVSWTRHTTATNSDIVGRVFSQFAASVPIGSGDEFIITSSATNDTLSTVSGLDAGRFVAAWQDSTAADGSSGRITAEVSDLFRTSLGDAARDPDRRRLAA